MTTTGTHGILNPRAGEGVFTLDRRAPSSDLAAFVDRYWIVRWQLRERAAFAQETLPHPYVHLVIGTHRPGVHGVGTKRFAAALEGEGFVVGVKFRPGGFFPFFGRDVIELSEREVPIPDVFGQDGARLEADVRAAPTDDARLDRIERFLRSREPACDAVAALAARAVDAALADPSLSRASRLADRVGVSPRTLDRIFRRYVGVGPKWIVRRFRIHEACERIAAGAPASWSALATELGYFDQAHFIRDFKSQVGRTPSGYAALTAPEIALPAPRGSPRRSPRTPRPSPASRRSAESR
jgi:AraC-like DNA-binding protein